MSSVIKKIKERLQKKFAENPRIRKHVLLWKRTYTANFGGYPQWKNIVKRVLTAEKTGASSNKPQILIATSVGAHLSSTTIESLLAVALNLRGAEVHVLLCDKVLPACMDCDNRWFPTEKEKEILVKNGPKMLCDTCYDPANKMYDELNIIMHRYSDFLTPQDDQESEKIANTISYKEIRNYKWQDMAVGEHAFAGALRFFSKGELTDEPQGEAVVRRYLKASLLTTWMAQRLFKENSFIAAAFNHGIYVPQGLIGEAARQAKVRIINWNPAYRKKCFIFSHDDTYHHTMMNEPTQKWENLDLEGKNQKILMDYLKSRWDGTQDWISFQHKPNSTQKKITAEFSLDPAKPIIGLLTNVVWDAQLHYPANAFENMLQWIIETIELFKSRPDLQLLIRVHPAEILGSVPSRQKVYDEVMRHFKKLPPNVFIILPEKKTSTYEAMMICDSVIIYGTKTGVELTSMGIPVIVAGEAWIRNKGLTVDISSRDQYKKIISELPLNKRLSEQQIQRARKYAFHFFFRRMIPLDFIEQGTGWPPFYISIHNLNQLMPGQSKGLDIICDGILKGTDFIFPAETLK